MKEISLYIMAVLYILAGANHFVKPKFYLRIMPPYIPWHKAMIYISGAAEIFLGLLLLCPPLSTLPGNTGRPAIFSRDISGEGGELKTSDPAAGAT